MQPCRMNVNSSGSSLTNCTDAVPTGNVLDLNLGFNSGTSNNGNVVLMAATGTQAFNRSYTYDWFNRLATMNQSSGNTTSCSSTYGLSWTYDIWGNRTDQNVTSGTCNASHVSVDAKNRLSSAPYQYDAAGNLTNDGNHSYTYDAENRLSQVDGGSSATYAYDAFGHRVEKITPSRTNDYIYDLAGNVVTEYCSTSTFTGWCTSYIYLNGALAAQYSDGTTYFAHKDHLGSTRLVSGVGTSQVSNGGFEQGLTNWTPSNSTLITDATRAHAGSQYVQLSASSGGGSSVWAPRTAVQPGDQITFGGWVYLESGGGGDLGWWIIVMDATQSTITYVATPNPTSAGWTFQSATYTVPSNGAYVQLYGQIWLPSSSTVLRVDDGFLYDDRLSLTVTDNLDFLPYGEQISGSSVTTHKFTSDERDSETNLDHTWFRQYSSSLGRWTTADPAGLAAAAFGNPQSLNQYAYVVDDPIDSSDPLGLWAGHTYFTGGRCGGEAGGGWSYFCFGSAGSFDWGRILPCAGFLNASGTANCPQPPPPPPPPPGNKEASKKMSCDEARAKLNNLLDQPADIAAATIKQAIPSLDWAAITSVGQLMKQLFQGGGVSGPAILEGAAYGAGAKIVYYTGKGGVLQTVHGARVLKATLDAKLACGETPDIMLDSLIDSVVNRIKASQQ